MKLKMMLYQKRSTSGRKGERRIYELNMSVGEIRSLEFAKSRDEDKKQQFFFFLCHQKIHIHEHIHIHDQSDRWN